MIATLTLGVLLRLHEFQIWGPRDRVWWMTAGGPEPRPCRGRPRGRARGSRWGPGPATSSPPPATGATGAGTGTEAAPDTGESSSDEITLITLPSFQEQGWGQPPWQRPLGHQHWQQLDRLRPGRVHREEPAEDKQILQRRRQFVNLEQT